MHFNSPKYLNFFGKTETLHSKHVDSLTGSLPQGLRRHPEKSWFPSCPPPPQPPTDNFKDRAPGQKVLQLWWQKFAMHSDVQRRKWQTKCQKVRGRDENAKGEFCLNNYIEKMKGMTDAARRNEGLCNPFKSRPVTFFINTVCQGLGKEYPLIPRINKRHKLKLTNKIIVNPPIQKVQFTHLWTNFWRQFTLWSGPLFVCFSVLLPQ